MNLTQYEYGASQIPPASPATPSTGYPTGGNPQTGIGATIPGPYWYFQIQAEIHAVVAAAGIAADRNNLTQLLSAIRALMPVPTDFIPIGTVIHVARSTAPSGWLIADGSLVLRADYPALFSVLEADGLVFGQGDGVTTFRLPDLRGMFLRGTDLGRGIDPLRSFGSIQADDLRTHTHTAAVSDSGPGANPVGDWLPGGNGVTPQVNGLHSHSVTVYNAGGAETRPWNVALLPCIKC